MKKLYILSFLILIISLQVYATENYSGFEKNTGTIVENINVSHVLKNADYINIINCDKNGITAYVGDLRDSQEDKSRYIYIEYSGKVTEYNSVYDSVPDYFKFPSIFSEGIARIEINNKKGYINENYKWIAYPEYSSVTNFSNGYGVVEEINEKYYLLDSNGKVCLEADNFYYEGTNSFYPGTVFRNGYAAYSKNKEVFYLDENLNSTKVNLGNECAFYDGEFMFNGGTLAYMYPEKINGDYTHRQIYRIFGHDGMETYRYIIELPKLEPVNDYSYINILANGNVIFETPYNFEDNFCKSKITHVSNYGEVLAESKEFDRYAGLYFVSIGDNICNTGNFYNMYLKKLDSINLKGDYFDSDDGSVAVNIDYTENTETNEIKINKLDVVRDSQIEINKSVKLVDPNKIKVNQISKPKDITVYINMNKVNFDVNPIVEKDRTLVPMRGIFEALEAKVEWDNERQTAIAIKDNITVSVTIDSNKMLKNGEEIELDVPARLVNDSRTLVPLRAISEAFGCQVEWDEELQRVDIYTN